MRRDFLYVLYQNGDLGTILLSRLRLRTCAPKGRSVSIASTKPGESSVHAESLLERGFTEASFEHAKQSSNSSADPGTSRPGGIPQPLVMQVSCRALTPTRALCGAPMLRRSCVKCGYLFTLFALSFMQVSRPTHRHGRASLIHELPPIAAGQHQAN